MLFDIVAKNTIIDTVILGNSRPTDRAADEVDSNFKYSNVIMNKSFKVKPNKTLKKCV